MLKIVDNLAVKVIIFIIVIILIVTNIYINANRIISQNKYTKSFNSSVEQHNLSITEFLSTLESAVEMLSKNEMIQYVSDDPEKYYNSTLDLLKTFQQAYSSTAFAYFAPENKIFGVKKLVSWPDTSEELSNDYWEPTQRPWYVDAINSNGKITWSKPYIDSTTKKYTITVSKSVIDKENKFKGVLAIDIYLDDLSKKMNYFREFNEGDIFIISRTDNENFFIIDNVKNGKSKAIFNNNIIDSLYSQKSGSLHSENITGNYYISYTTNTVTGWKVVGAIEEHQLTKETKGIITNIFIGVIAILFMSIISILYITKQMGSTIQSLSGSIKATEEKTLPKSTKINLFQIESEELLFEKPTSNINILFEIEAEKERINNLIKNTSDFNSANAKELKILLTRLSNYKAKLNLSVKSHEIQMVSVNNYLFKIQEYINSLHKNSISIELKTELMQLDEFINSIINS
ncbi:cache domain-containing protein [Clostridium peptidivorans]|uniref:cache domain-containing protein n=1 Tax=Clostridium peptidivorans TaxID=100174 RepID=UPI000BE40401|nr:cache domain-containing protein [Clostridium peptidivorans]